MSVLISVLATLNGVLRSRARNAWQLRETGTEIVALIDQLLDQHTDGAIATMLNARGYVSGTGRPFQRASCNTSDTAMDSVPGMRASVPAGC